MARTKTNITLIGVRELRQLLDQLPKRVVKKGLRRAVQAGSTPMSREAKRRAPRESGLLKRAITRKVKTYSSGNAAAIIGANQNIVGEYKGRKRVPANYIHLIEASTKPHLITQPLRHRVLRHPGTTGTHFLVSAYNSNLAAAETIMARKLAETVESEAAKLGRRKG